MTKQDQKTRERRDRDATEPDPEAKLPASKQTDPTKAAPKRNPGHNVDTNPAQGGPSTRRNPEAGKPQDKRKRGRH